MAIVIGSPLVRPSETPALVQVPVDIFMTLTESLLGTRTRANLNWLTTTAVGTWVSVAWVVTVPEGSETVWTSHALEQLPVPPVVSATTRKEGASPLEYHSASPTGAWVSEAGLPTTAPVLESTVSTSAGDWIAT